MKKKIDQLFERAFERDQGHCQRNATRETAHGRDLDSKRHMLAPTSAKVSQAPVTAHKAHALDARPAPPTRNADLLSHERQSEITTTKLPETPNASTQHCACNPYTGKQARRRRRALESLRPKEPSGSEA